MDQSEVVNDIVPLIERVRNSQAAKGEACITVFRNNTGQAVVGAASADSFVLLSANKRNKKVDAVIDRLLDLASDFLEAVDTSNKK